MTESDPEAVAVFADRMVVLDGGQVAKEGTPRDLFCQAERMAALGVAVPQMAQVATALNRRLGTGFEFLTQNEAEQALAVHLG